MRRYPQMEPQYGMGQQQQTGMGGFQAPTMGGYQPPAPITPTILTPQTLRNLGPPPTTPPTSIGATTSMGGGNTGGFGAPSSGGMGGFGGGSMAGYTPVQPTPIGSGPRGFAVGGGAPTPTGSTGGGIGGFGAPPMGGGISAPPMGGGIGAPMGGGIGAPPMGGSFGAPPMGGSIGAPPMGGSAPMGRTIGAPPTGPAAPSTTTATPPQSSVGFGGGFSSGARLSQSEPPSASTSTATTSSTAPSAPGSGPATSGESGAPGDASNPSGYNPYSSAAGAYSTPQDHAHAQAHGRRYAEQDMEGFAGDFGAEMGGVTAGMGSMTMHNPASGQQGGIGQGQMQPQGARIPIAGINEWGDASKPNPAAQCPEAYLRMTVNAVPTSSQLLQKAAIPFGCIVHPLAQPDNYTLPIVNFGKMGIARCRRCRAYINPFVQFIEGGRRWRCNMCGLPNDVPAEYFCEVDQMGRRLDTEQRPELSRGCVEYLAPAEYMVRRPMPPTYFFVIDVSYYAVSSGMLKTCVDTIKASLNSLPERSNVGFLTFDNTVHFYHLKSTLSQPRMLVVSDIDDVFLPLPDDMLVNLQESRKVVDSLLDRLPAIHQFTQTVEVATGPALKAAWNVMRLVGGKLMLFLGKMPSLGLGTLKMREDMKLLGTDKENEMLQPDNKSDFYEAFALDCSRQQIAVDCFLFSPQYTDVATLSSLSRITAGQTFYYPSFSILKDGDKFSGDLQHVLTRETGWEGVLRMRASKGLKITAYYGNYSIRTTDLLALPVVDTDKAFGVQFAVNENLTAVKYISVQNALLYTTSAGERRIRVATVCLPVTPHLADMFKFADADAVITLTAKMAVDKALKFKLSDAREALVHKCTDVLAAYRASFATGGTTNTQLLLPESLKTLPLFTLAMVKSIALRSGTDIRPDERSYYLALLRSMSCSDTIRFLYPALYALHTLSGDAGTPAPAPTPLHPLPSTPTPPSSHPSPAPSTVPAHVPETPKTPRVTHHLPAPLSLSTEKMERQGVYLLDDGLYLLIWVGRQASPELLNALFGVPVLDDQHLQLVRQNNEYSERVCNIVDTLRGQHPPHQKLYVIREGDPMEYRFFAHFVDDKSRNNLPSYYEFLVQLQRQIQNRAK